jgi:hypothetical protein
MLLDDLAALDPPQRREVAVVLRNVAETFAEVPDGRDAAHALSGCSTPLIERMTLVVVLAPGRRSRSPPRQWGIGDR